MSSSVLQPHVRREVAGFGVETTVPPLPSHQPSVGWVIRDASSVVRAPRPTAGLHPSLLRLVVNGLGTFTSTAVVVLLLLAVVPLLSGRPPTVVASGSMEPTLHRGDVVILREAAADLPLGAVVAFETVKGRVIHRLVDMTADGAYITKGDANDSADSTPLVSADIVGVGVMLVPFIGLPNLWYIEHRWGNLTTGGFLVGLSARVGSESWLYRETRPSRSRSKR